MNEETDIIVTASSGLRSGVQFQRVHGAGIGIQSILDAGAIDAVDVWGNILGTVEDCFPQSGRTLFLDAAYSPRTVSWITSTARADGYTCDTIDRAGTIVLMPPEESEVI